MPNAWSKLLQQTYECFNGPRTVDYEYLKLVEEVKKVRSKIFTVKEIIQSWPERTMPMKGMLLDINTWFSSPIDKDSDFYGFSVDICKVHKEMENSYSACCNAMEGLGKSINEWNQKFLQIKEGIDKREELRKTYDHYDQKLEELVKARNEKFNRGKAETPKEIEHFERNEKKFIDAANAFVKESNISYTNMVRLLDERYLFIIPAYCTFLEYERIFFSQCATFLNYFKGAKDKLAPFLKRIKRTKIIYNAKTFLRGSGILSMEGRNNLFVEEGMLGGGISYQPPRNYGNMGPQMGNNYNRQNRPNNNYMGPDKRNVNLYPGAKNQKGIMLKKKIF